jgi:hypothetical protein
MQLDKPGKLIERNSFPSPYAAANAIQSAHLPITCMRHLSYVNSGSTLSSPPGADVRLSAHEVVSKLKFPQGILVQVEHLTASVTRAPFILRSSTGFALTSGELWQSNHCI